MRLCADFKSRYTPSSATLKLPSKTASITKPTLAKAWFLLAISSINEKNGESASDVDAFAQQKNHVVGQVLGHLCLSWAIAAGGSDISALATAVGANPKIVEITRAADRPGR